MEMNRQYNNTFINLRHKALKFKREENYEQALKFIDEALAFEKEHHDLLADKAEVLYQMKSYHQSIEIFKELLTIDKGRYSYLHGYYKCLYRLKRDIGISDIDNLIYLKEEDSLFFFEKTLIKNQKDNEQFRECLINYFPEYMLPDSVIHLTMKEARGIISRAFEKPNQRKRMLVLVYFEKGLYKSLFSYLSKEIKKAPYKWINYELYSEYKNLLKKTEDALEVIKQFENQNPDRVLESATNHVTLLMESGKLECAIEIVRKNQNLLSDKEHSNMKVEDYEYKKLNRLYEIIGNLDPSN